VGVMQRFERRVEHLLDGAFAKAFKEEVQPVELAAALQRECASRAAIVSRGRSMVPNTYTVELGDQDFERLSGYAATLGGELAELLRGYAAEQRYAFLGPISVTFDHAPGLDLGRFQIRSAVVPGPLPPPVLPTAWLEFNGTTTSVTGQRIVIGRGSSVDIRVDDPGVSRRHAEVWVTPEGGAVRDMGSTNGLLVNSYPVGETSLADGDHILVGSSTLVFRIGGE
jgi:hypothetical protein